MDLVLSPVTASFSTFFFYEDTRKMTDLPCEVEKRETGWEEETKESERKIQRMRLNDLGEEGNNISFILLLQIRFQFLSCTPATGKGWRQNWQWSFTHLAAKPCLKSITKHLRSKGHWRISPDRLRREKKPELHIDICKTVSLAWNAMRRIMECNRTLMTRAF